MYFNVTDEGYIYRPTVRRYSNPHSPLKHICKNWEQYIYDYHISTNEPNLLDILKISADDLEEAAEEMRWMYNGTGDERSRSRANFNYQNNLETLETHEITAIKILEKINAIITVQNIVRKLI